MRRLAGVVLALLAAVGSGAPSGAAGPAPDLPDAATLLAAVAKAAGPEPRNYRDTIVAEGPYGTTTTRAFRNDDDVRVTVDHGPLHTEHGISKGERWHQNANGLTVVEEPEPGLARSEATTSRVTRVTQPVDAFELSILTRGGLGTRELIDAQTFRLLRLVKITAAGTETTTYEGYAYYGPRSLATRWVVDDSRFKTRTVMTRTSFDAGSASANDVAEPPIRRPLVEFPEGQTRVQLPARFENDRIYVRVNVGARGLDFLLDTGSAGIALDPGTAKSLGLTLLNRGNAVNAGASETYDTIVPQLEIGSLRMHDIVVHTAPVASDESTSTRLVGLLGFDFLATLGVRIDYEHRTVTVEPAETFRPPSDPAAMQLDLRLAVQIPTTSVRIDNLPAERVGLDTGAHGTLLLFDYFARRYPETVKSRIGVQRFQGVGGVFETVAVRLDDVALGRFHYRNSVGYQVTNRGSYPFNYDGVIGSSLLRLFTVTLDYAHGRAFLERNGLAPT